MSLINPWAIDLKIYSTHLRGSSDKVCHGMDDDSRQPCCRNPIKCWCQTIQSHKDDNSGQNASQRSADTGFGFQSSSGERSCSRVCTEARTNGIRDSNRNQLLVRIYLIPVQATES